MTVSIELRFVTFTLGFRARRQSNARTGGRTSRRLRIAVQSIVQIVEADGNGKRGGRSRASRRGRTGIQRRSVVRASRRPHARFSRRKRKCSAWRFG
eukprot:scaffold388_cov244-Pinguiococcus_pyrenoidosus.AAC.22